MKIAICFSGAIRNFDDCASSTIKYFIDSLRNSNHENTIQTDIFLHMWVFNDSLENKIQHNFKWRKDNSSIEKILNILSPTKYVIEEYTNQSEKLIIEKSKIQMDKFDTEQKKNYGFNACSMYWKIFKCFELAESHSIENNFEYDLVFRARLDFIWEDYIKIQDFIESTENNIYLIKDRYATMSKLQTNDKFFGGNMKVMKKMCNLFNHIWEYQTEGLFIEGQTLNEIHIKKQNFNVKWIGHLNTYYKFMARHTIKSKGKSILLDINNLFDFENSNINYSNELAYLLLNNGYNVSCTHKNIPTYNKINPRYIKFIQIQTKYDIIISNLEKSIIIKFNNNDKCELNISKETLDKIENNFVYLNDFILSLIYSNSNLNSNSNYNFKYIKQIYEIDEKEPILYKYLDHGYYHCEYLHMNNDKSNYIIKFDNKNIAIKRNNFKIINLYKYYENDYLPIN